jgi:SAM-dependent methyltransferase
MRRSCGLAHPARPSDRQRVYPAGKPIDPTGVMATIYNLLGTFARRPEEYPMESRKWDERYAGPGFAYGTEPNDFLVSVADRIPPGPVLTLGEGEGRNAVFLAGQGHDVLAVDQSEVGLAKARRRAAERGLQIQTQQADLRDFTIEPGAWAGIVSIFCHLPLPIRVPVHAAVVRGLRPGGVFVLEAYTPRQFGRGTGGPPSPEMMVTLADLTAELAGLEFVHAREGEREVREGSYHTGLASVVQIVARRRTIEPTTTDPRR